MNLRRVTHVLRAQNRLTVVLEVDIVVVGMIIGLPVTDHRPGVSTLSWHANLPQSRDSGCGELIAAGVLSLTGLRVSDCSTTAPCRESGVNPDYTADGRN